MSKLIDVGWSFGNPKGSSIFFDPEPASPFNPADKNINEKEGVRACPAVRAIASNLYLVKCPYSIRLRANQVPGRIEIRPVYPDTEVSEASLLSVVSFEPRRLWINKDRPIIQLKTPYVFFSDSQASLSQLEAPSPSAVKNWSLIQGTIDIYNWQRSLNFAFQWIDINNDLVIKRGDPAFQIMFSTPLRNSGFRLQKVELSKELKNRIDSCEGITSLVRNTAVVMRSSRPSRLKLLQKS